MRNLYDKDKKQWDLFQRFYSGEPSKWVFFEDGSYKFGYGGVPDVDKRQYYPAQRAVILDSNLYIGNQRALMHNEGIKEFSIIDPVTGKKVPKAQLGYNGMIAMVWDLDTNKVYKANREEYRDLNLAEHLRKSSFAVSKSGKVLADKIAFYAPYKPTKQDIDWITQATVASKLIHANEYIPEYAIYNSSHSQFRMIDPGTIRTTSPGEFIKSLSNYPKQHMLAIIGAMRANKLEVGREKITRDYLVMEVKK